MDRLPQRSTDVDDALCEPLPRNAARPADEAGAFDALYRRAFPRVYAYAASLLRDRAAAEDVTALAFERAYRRRHRYRASRGTADAWLFGIARNAALDEPTRPPPRTSPAPRCGARSSAARSTASTRASASSLR
jgi:DNA-directed RNA polymerase specialized sigma24 family protein